MEKLKIKNDSKSFLCWHKEDLKDWKFWFKLVFVLVMSAVVLDLYIRPIVNNVGYINQINDLISTNKWTSLSELINYGVAHNSPWLSVGTTGDNKPIYDLISTIGLTITSIDGVASMKAIYNPFEEVVAQSSYFTTISNVLILVWMFIALCKPQDEGKHGLLNVKWSVISATYITITFLIYNLALRVVNGNPSNVLDIISNECLHTIAPIAFVAYVLVAVKYEKDEQLNFTNLKKSWAWSVCLLITYGVYAVVRGVIKWSGGATNDESYPYFFMQVTNPSSVGGIHGAIWFVIFIFIIAGLCIGLTTLYNFIIIKMTNLKLKNQSR